MDSVPRGRHEEPAGLSPEELEAESAEALPERAAMSTLSVGGLDATTGAVEAVGDGMTETAAATTEAPEAPVETTEAPVEATTTAADPAEAAPIQTMAPEGTDEQASTDTSDRPGN